MINLENLSFLIEPIRHNRLLRRKLAKYSHPLFFLLYLNHYIKKPTADFQREIFSLTENKKVDFAVITAFRGSAKSTICTTSFPIWVMVSGQAHFIVIASQTRQQAREHLASIKGELETNGLLRNDLGPFEEQADEWGAYALTFKQYDAKIIAVSTEQAIRGMRHKQYRPDLIICDDIEDINSTRTKESRNKIYTWFHSEIIPLGTANVTRIFVLGNFLQEYSLVGKLMDQIQKQERDGIYKLYPLLDKEGVCIWPGMYPDSDAVEKFKRKIGDDAAWHREYLLQIISGADQVVHPEWIHTYKYPDELPTDDQLSEIFIGVDLASSQNSGADYVSMVTLKIYYVGEQYKAYVMPHPLNERIEFPDQVKTIKQLAFGLRGRCYPKIYIEKVGYQESIGQQLERDGVKVEMTPVHGNKRDRLAAATPAIKEGLVVFPEKGIDDLQMQLIGFEIEKHDDLADAFSLVVNEFIAYCNMPRPGITVITLSRRRGGGLSSWMDDDDDYDFEITRGDLGL